MNISEKIETIRQQPEHIRIRYVWGCVAVSMFVILIVWIFSVFSMFGKISTTTVSNQKSDASTEDLQQQLQGFQKQTESIKDLGQQINSIGEGIGSAPLTGEAPYPATSINNPELPASSNYSDLSNAGLSQ